MTDHCIRLFTPFRFLCFVVFLFFVLLISSVCYVFYLFFFNCLIGQRLGFLLGVLLFLFRIIFTILVISSSWRVFFYFSLNFPHSFVRVSIFFFFTSFVFFFLLLFSFFIFPSSLSGENEVYQPQCDLLPRFLLNTRRNGNVLR